MVNNSNIFKYIRVKIFTWTWRIGHVDTAVSCLSAILTSLLNICDAEYISANKNMYLILCHCSTPTCPRQLKSSLMIDYEPLVLPCQFHIIDIVSGVCLFLWNSTFPVLVKWQILSDLLTQSNRRLARPVDMLAFGPVENSCLDPLHKQ